MSWLRRYWFRLRTLVGRAGLEEQLDEELRFHLEMQTAAHVARGMPAASANALARAQFGSVSQHKDDYRDRWGARHLEAFAQDLRMGARHASSTPGTSLAIVVALALGIGVSTAVFAVFHAVLLRPLPYADADRLVRVRASTPAHTRDGRFSATEERLFSAPEIRDLRASSTTLDGVAEFHFMYFILLDLDQPQRVSAGVVSSNFFDVAGVSPILGRAFTLEDERPGAPTTIVLSHRYWQRGFRADPGVVGRVVTMNDHAHTIVGVLPPLPDFPEEADIYLPSAACPTRGSVQGDTDRAMHLVSAIGRVRPGMPADAPAVNADLGQVAERLVQEHPADYAPLFRPTLTAVPVVHDLTVRFRPMLAVLVASAGFLFLSLCASTGALMLANALRRWQQLAVQVALGAWRGRLFRQGAAEALILSGVGAAAGLVVAAAILPPLAALASRFTVRASEIRFDDTTLAFGLAMTCGTSLLFGLVPIFAAAAPTSALHQSRLDRSTAAARHPIFRSLIVIQIAVSFALLVGAALTVRSVVNLERIETGYQTTNLTTFRLPTDFFKYNSLETRTKLADGLRNSLRAMPGIDAVSIAGALPLVSSGNSGEVLVETRRQPSGAGIARASQQIVSPGHFATIGLPLLEGRDFSDADSADARAVAVINRGMAERYFGNTGAIGQEIRVGSETWLTIVGVTSDARQRLSERPQDEVFRPMAQLAPEDQTLTVQPRFIIRSAIAREQLERMVRDQMALVDPHQPIDSVMTFDSVREESVAPFRLTATLIGIFAAVALAISIVGVGGVVGASTSSRTHEFGVRLALGATRRELLFSVLQEGLRLSAWGLGCGLALAWALSRVLRSRLFEVPPHDVPTFGGVAVLLIVIILAACLVPARRAVRADPLVAIRAN